MHPSATTVGDRIRQARLDAGLSQQVLATRAGIAVRTLTRIEHGDNFQVSTMQAIAAVLDLTVADLTAA